MTLYNYQITIVYTVYTMDRKVNGARAVIGALAMDIRGSWTYPDARVKVMKALCRDYGFGRWERELHEWDFEDGRYFRDEWSGPYRECTLDDLDAVGLTKDIFDYPDSVIIELRD